MKKLIFAGLLLVMLLTVAKEGFCAIKYIDPYYRNDGTSVSGHYRDTSNDGVRWNNANELGYNQKGW